MWLTVFCKELLLSLPYHWRSLEIKASVPEKCYLWASCWRPMGGNDRKGGNVVQQELESHSFHVFTLYSNRPDLFCVWCQTLFHMIQQQAQSDYSNTSGMNLTWGPKAFIYLPAPGPQFVITRGIMYYACARWWHHNSGMKYKLWYGLLIVGSCEGFH